MCAGVKACGAMQKSGVDTAPCCRVSGVERVEWCSAECAQLCSHLSLHPIPNFAPTPTPTHNPPRFYQYTITKPLDVKLPGEEAIHGMTLTSPYASTASPDAAWWDNMTSFLDGAAAAGFRVNFQLIGFEQKGNDAGTLANLTAQIERFKDHPAIMAWCVLVLLWRRGGEGEEAERRRGGEAEHSGTEVQ